MEEKRRVSDEEFKAAYERFDGDEELIAKELNYHVNSIGRKCVQLGLRDVKHIFTDEELTRIFNDSNGDVRKVVEVTGLHRNTVDKRLKLIGLVFVKQVITDQQIIDACKSSSNMREACISLGMATTSFVRRAKRLGVYNPNQGDTKNRPKKLLSGYSLVDILDGKYPQYQSNSLRKRLIKEGIFKDECSKCGFDQKREGFDFSVCELNHINGNPRDHRLENLEILCPNCHALTPNYRYVSRSE